MTLDPLAGVRRQYAREADRYDRRWARYLESTLKPTLAALSPGPGDRVLDVGCGTGLLLQQLVRRWPAVDAHGLDASTPMLRAARRRLPTRVGLAAGDVHRLPFPTAAFDLTVTSSSFHYWSDPATALAELARVTRPAGRLVLTDWSDDFLALRLFSRALQLFDAAHHRSYSAAETESMARDAGFVVDSVRHFRVGRVWGMMTVTATRR